MIKDSVLENIRHLTLTINDKIAISSCYNNVTQVQKDEFENAVKCYKGRVNNDFKVNKLYDRYVYALNARDNNSINMVDYLKIHGSFKKKRATSFRI